MNKTIIPLIVLLLFSGSTSYNLTAQRTDLIGKWDSIRPLVNPDKGWYHHMLDNGINKYLIQDEKDLIRFPRDGSSLPATGLGLSGAGRR